MDESPLNILQVSQFDLAGGAERVAMNLLGAYRRAGHRAKFAVGCRRSNDPDVLEIDNDSARRAWARSWLRVERSLPPVDAFRGAGRLVTLARFIGQPVRRRRIAAGREDFDFPATGDLEKIYRRAIRKAGDSDSTIADDKLIIHCHNLHTNYFDLRQLARLSRSHPLVLTLHDMWLLTGHCAHPLDCPRWESGCGSCPYLGTYPPVRRDATAFNWNRKRGIYADCRLHVATPSAWLMEKVERSMLWDGVIEAKVIPNGVDRAVFKPGSRQDAREALGLDQEAKILLFAGAGTRSNAFKDYATLHRAIGMLGGRVGGSLLLLALGENLPDEVVGRATIRFIPFQRDPVRVALYYQACDLYLHASRADTFPNSILEAMSCGRPVVATRVGGIPEQIDDRVTGVLVKPGDAGEMADAVARLLEHGEIVEEMGRRAAQVAAERFSLERQADAYLNWYRAILRKFTMEPAPQCH